MVHDLTADDLRRLLDYDQETGVFTRKVRTSNRINAGDKAGGLSGPGYIYISVLGRRYLAQRLAWFYVHGEWPSEYIDHVNGDTIDNRIANLRLATNSQNQANARTPKNSKSGVKGVTWSNRLHKWRAQICINRRSQHLGLFSNFEDAEAAYERAALMYFGDFASSTR